MNLDIQNKTTPHLPDLLARVVKDDVTHARWINTFSYLEYVGFRKIVKSQQRSQISVETLTHAVEEGRHALRLKKLAIKIGGLKFDHYSNETTICLEEAQRYIQELDRACESNAAQLNYFYVTWLIELRALEVYSLYARVAPRFMQHQLQSLIGEESIHLAKVLKHLRERDSEFQIRGMRLQKIEEDLYKEYLGALCREL